MGKFQKQVAIITGASSGIGEATAIALAKEGANVVITGRNEERLAKVAKECKAAGVEVLEIISDLGKFENLEPVITKTVEKFQRIDILVNNAAMGLYGPIETLEQSDFDGNFAVNVRGPVFLCKYALPHLKKTKGSVVNISSAGGLRAERNLVTYSMAKAALQHFTRGFAAECANDGIRVNTICPGAVETRFGDRLGFPKEVVDQMVMEFVKLQPFGIMQPHTIAEAILFLCSSTHITGITMPVDGGILLPK